MNGGTQCEGRREAIAALVMNELPPRATEELCRHIEECDFCRSLRDALVEEERQVRAGFDAIAQSAQTLVRRFEERERQPTKHAQTASRQIAPGLTSMRPVYKALSAALIVCVVGGVFWLLAGRGGPGIAFADVVAQMRQVRSATWKMTITVGEGDGSIGKRAVHVHGQNLDLRKLIVQ